MSTGVGSGAGAGSGSEMGGAGDGAQAANARRTAPFHDHRRAHSGVPGVTVVTSRAAAR
jgi:hypothetical protein